jgi:hypothetical protein
VVVVVLLLRKQRIRDRGQEVGGYLSAETVEGASLALESVDDIEGGDGLALGVLGVGDGITDDVLEEDLEDGAGLLVDEAGDTLDTTTTGETTDGGLGDTLDVVAKNLAVALGTTLSETLSTFTAARHDVK